MPTMKELERWMGTGQVTSCLGYSRQGVVNLARNRRVRSAYVGLEAEERGVGRGVWIFDPESVEEYAAKHRLPKAKAGLKEEQRG